MISNRQFLINVVAHSEHIKKNTTLKEQIQMLRWIKKLPNSHITKILEDTKLPKSSNAIKKVLKLGFAASVVAFPGGVTLLTTINYLKDSFNYKCELKCKSSENPALCADRCIVQSLQYIIKMLEKSYNDCASTRKPLKCRKRLHSVIKTYRIKLIKAESRLSISTRKASIRRS